MSTQRDAVFLTWIEHRRTRAMSSRLGIELAEIVTRRKGMARYFELLLRTLAYLVRRRPRALIVQTPSMILGVLALLLRPLLRYTLVFDAHNEAVEPYLHSSAVVVRISHWLARAADGIIVTNEPLARKVRALGGQPIVLFDPIPEAPDVPGLRRPGAFTAAVISTFAADEPLDQVFLAARELGDGVQFYVTGNPAKLRGALREQQPANVSLTGFLAEADYWQLLRSVDLVVDLTAMPDCLVCGAYEAVAVATPLMLTDSEVSRDLFEDAALYVHNETLAIVSGIRRAMGELERVKKSAISAAPRLNMRWERQSLTLRQILAGRAPC